MRQDFRERNVPDLDGSIVMLLLTSLAVMAAAVTLQHLGLTSAIADVLDKVLRCPKCLAFWSTLIYLFVVAGQSLSQALGAAVLMAYLSHWFGLLLMRLSKLYDSLWQRARQRHRPVHR